MPFQSFDQEELTHLALLAINQKQYGEAMGLLIRSLEQDSKQARAYYLLGAEYAQARLHEQAIESMRKAIELDPHLHLATFQLGLIYLTQGLPENAADTWTPLSKLSRQDPLRLFSTGLTHLANDELELFRKNVQEGMLSNQAIPSLNRDMQRTLEAVASFKYSAPTTLLGSRDFCI